MALTITMVSNSAWLGIHYMPSPTITFQGRSAIINQNSISPISTTSTTWTAVDGANNVVGTGTVTAGATSITVCSAGNWVGGGAVVPGYYTIYTGAGSAGVVTGTCVICTAGSQLYVPNSSGDTYINLSAWIGGAPDRDYYNLGGVVNPGWQWVTNVTFNGTNIVTLNNPGVGESFSDIKPGALVMSTLVPPGTTVLSVDSATQIHMNAAATGSSTSGTMYVSPDVVTTYTAAMVTQLGNDAYFTGPQDSARPHRFWIGPGWQSVAPTQAPDPTYWGQVATYLAAHGHAGGYYECPTNEPENGGWSTANTTTYWNACAAAILAADSTAKLVGFDSGGIYNDTPITGVASFLGNSYVNAHINAFSNHMEASNQNLSDILLLRQYLGGLKAQFAASGLPNLDLRLTETGIEPGQYNILHPRREARQRTMLRFVMESYGWCKENCYDFPVVDHQGSNIGTYMVDVTNGFNAGNMRAGAYACHVQSEAMYGTSCSPTNIPAALSFGPTGSIGDSLFAGLHYTGTTRDVVVLATNGLESDTVTLQVSSTAGVSAWDGWGNTRSVTVAGNQITVAVDDLLTYVFLPTGSTVSVVDTGTNVVTSLNSAINLAYRAASFVNESSASVAGVLNNGNFAKNLSGITGVKTPYSDSTVPGSITASSFWSNPSGQPVQAVVIKAGGPAWQTWGCSLTSFNIVATIGGVATTVYSYTQSGAVSYAIPGGCNGNSSDITTRTTWWKNPFAWIVPLSLSGPVTSLQLNITGTSYGGQPDLAASTVVENDSQNILLSEFQILQANVGPVGPQFPIRATG